MIKEEGYYITRTQETLRREAVCKTVTCIKCWVTLIGRENPSKDLCQVECYYGGNKIKSFNYYLKGLMHPR